MDQDRSNPTPPVSLDERRLARRDPALLQVERYWEGLKGGRLVPDRAEVDPRGLTGALEHAFVLEQIAPGISRFRVAGMHLSDLMGLEVRGMPISAVFAPESRPELSRALQATFSEPARIRMQLKGEDGIGRPKLIGELVLLPLRSDGGDVTRALGCLVMEGTVGRQPRRLSITSVDHQTLTGYADADGVDPAASTGFREPPASYTAAPTEAPASTPTAGKPSEPKVRHLRLVHSQELPRR